MGQRQNGEPGLLAPQQHCESSPVGVGGELARDEPSDPNTARSAAETLKLAETASALSERADDLRLRRLLDLIQKGALDHDIYEAIVNGTVYFLDEEPPTPDLEQGFRLRVKCELLGFESVDALLDAVRGSRPAIVLLGARAPGGDASQILPELLVSTFGAEAIPVVLFSDDEAWARAFEVLTYPRIVFVDKARGADGFVEAIGQFAEVEQPEKAIVSDSDLREQIGLSKAQAIQQKLLPESIPSVAGIEIAVYYEPCQVVGGDYYDFFPMADGRLGVVCADVSGKGVSAAMVMVMFRAILRLAAQQGKSPRDVILMTNQQVTRDMLRGMFVSALYLVIDPATGTTQFVNAGHMPLIHWPAEQARPVEVPAKGMVVGLADGRRFVAATRQSETIVHPGELLCLYTDGVVEAENPDREQYGTGRLLETIRGAGLAASAQDIVDRVMADVRDFCAGAPQHDDTTLIILKAA